jgi:hypothetical protein
MQLPSFALAYLLDRFCGQTPDKKFQLADWRLRPLSEQARFNRALIEPEQSLNRALIEP